MKEKKEDKLSLYVGSDAEESISYTVSIIIPLYNAEKYISRCIDSVIVQTYRKIELIIVDDCSTDNSLDICKEYAKKDSRIRIFKNVKNMGTMWSRKIGYENASGSYFMFGDNDDYFSANAVELLYKRIVTKKADAVYGAFQLVNVDGKLGSIRYSRFNYGLDLLGIYQSILKVEIPPSLWRVMYDRRLFDNYKYITYMNVTRGEDPLLTYQLIKNIKKICTIDDVVYFYVANKTSVTNARPTDAKVIELTKVMNLQYDMISSYKELTPFFITTYLTMLVYVLKRNHNIKLILGNTTIPRLEESFTIKKLRSYYKGNIKRVYFYHLVLNYSFFRRLLSYNYIYQWYLEYAKNRR